MGFLGALASQMESQFSLGENQNNTLDAVIEGQNVKYGSLGDFAKQFDQSAERKYVEQGYLRKDPYNTVPKQFEILTQEPNATVLVKKRMFSSIAENFRPDFMDSDEKLYYRAIKILFQNKCNQIANLEKLSKIQKVTSLVGQIDNYMIPLILSLTDSFSKNFEENALVKEGEGDKLVKIVDRLRRIYSYNITSPMTNWIVDNTNLLKSQYAEGTGVLEITNFTNINTNVSVDMNNPGTCSFTIFDPYEVMLITEYDIERAIADATNAFYKSKTFQMGRESTELLISELQSRLNQYRAERGASPISFKINPDTLLGKRVVAIIDRIGESIPFTYDALGSLLTLGFKGGQNVGVEVPPEYLKGGAIAGLDGLDTDKKKSNNGVKMAAPDSELNLFCRLIKTIFDRMTLMANSDNAFQTTNAKTNYTRRKLRFNFLGKLLIQPMDVVHVYLSSKSKYDSKLLGGLTNMFSGLGFLQKANKELMDLKNAFDTVFNPQANLDLQIEKAAFVGKEFPNELWAMVRSQFINENEGVHIFGGIVEGATDNWADGKYSVDVRCKDNTTYFEMGKINFKPSVDVFNGELFNPLTPFKSNFDTITSNAKAESPELLEENKWLLSETANGGIGDQPITKHKNGPSVGLPITSKSVIQDGSIDPLTGQLTRTFYAPDGLVYKWKEGIGVLVQFGSSTELNSPSKVGFPTIYKDPFAGQDVMNVISLLITGIPYNFTTYWKAVGAPNYSGDPYANTTAANTYYESLRSSLVKNNLLWGNFIPFKTLSIDEDSYAKKLQGQFDIVKQNDEINAKLKELQNTFDLMKTYKCIDILKDRLTETLTQRKDANYLQLKTQADSLEQQIQKLVSESVKLDKDKSYYSFGDDVSFDVSDDIDSFANGTGNTTEQNSLSKAAYRRKLRRQLNYLTRRMSYNVRANDDKNLFIVDDAYDKDFDIMAYNQGLTDIKLFHNEFLSVKDSIRNTATLLNLEVFCDTQGHIRVRPPQYNRMPSSVFYNMMYMKDSMNIQVFPEFLSSLFNNQLETLKLQIEVIEDYIRLYCAILGFSSESEESSDIIAVNFIRSNSVEATKGDNIPFYFLSNPKGYISDIENIVKNANPDTQDVNDQGLSTFVQILSQATTKQNIFAPSARAKSIVKILKDKQLDGAGFSIDNIERVKQSTRAQEVIERINTKSGDKIKLENYLSKKQISYIDGVVINEDYSVDIFKVMDGLSSKIAERQKVMKLFYSQIKNYSEYKTLDTDSSMTNKLLAPGNYGNSNIPEVLEHMIEDESYDDLGPGSGKRYIIRRPQIKSMNFAEYAPSTTCVEVQGTLNSFAPESLPDSLRSFPQGGNGMTAAMAIDYDMWRNYGFRNQAPINVPFLRDPSLQCAPFATMVLSRARKEVLRGTVVITGNEYMQPGEVVFIEDRGLLFYVNSVKHNFQFGAGFTTTLELTYGHAPGEYIPTTLDVMGKMLFNNRNLDNIIVQRQSSSLNESSLGVLKYDKNAALVVNKKDNFENRYSQENLRVINNLLYSVQRFINNNTLEDGKRTKITRVQLRLYFDSNNAIDDDLKKFVEAIKYTLRGQYDLGTDASYDATVKASVPWIDNEKALEVVYIDLSDENDPHSPSQAAINAARDMIATQGSSDGGASAPTNTSDGGNNATKSNEDTTNNANSQVAVKKKRSQLRSMLFKYIVDCWLVYEDV